MAQDLTIAQWDLLIRQARASNLLGRLANTLQAQIDSGCVPERARNHLDSSAMKAERQHQSIKAEARSFQQLFKGSGITPVFLKGAAYVLTEVANEGRTCSDIDLLVPRSQLERATRLLCEDYWAPTIMDDYDREYYRQWAHEIPPLKHLERGTVLDLHHNILPLTARTQVEAEKLISERVSIEGTELSVLRAEDQILHSAAHLFFEGEFEKGLRDLTDLDILFREYARDDENFYTRLLDRSKELGLQHPLFLATRYCHRILETPLPESFIRSTLVNNRTVAAKLPLTDFLFESVLVPYHSSCSTARFRLSRSILYIRGHLLRMPLHLLVPHLTKKSIRAFTEMTANTKT